MKTFFAVLLLAGCAMGQANGKRLIFVSHSGDDPAGIRLAFALKEAILKSSSYALAETNDHENGQFIVELISMDIPKQHDGDIQDSAVSMMTHVQIGAVEMPVGHDLFFTALELTDNQAQTALAILDTEIVRTITGLKKALAASPASTATQPPH
jgi:hypothetical protein